MFKYIKTFFTALNANAHPGDVAHGVAIGLLLALVPKGNLLWFFLFFLSLFIRINKGAFFLSLLLLAFVVPLADGPVESLGYAILSFKPLAPAFGLLYDTPFVGLTRFNNTMVMGSLVAGLALYIPAYLASRAFVSFYRKRLQPRIVTSKVYRVFLNLPLIKQIANATPIGGDR